MRRNHKIWLLAAVAILLLLLVCRESYHFYSGLRHLDLPTQETREPLGRSAHGWMNPEDLAYFYKVPIESVFAALDIQPSPGDEKLPLRELAEKYDKSPSEIQAALDSLHDQLPSRGGSRDG